MYSAVAFCYFSSYWITIWDLYVGLSFCSILKTFFLLFQQLCHLRSICWTVILQYIENFISVISAVMPFEIYMLDCYSAVYYWKHDFCYFSYNYRSINTSLDYTLYLKNELHNIPWNFGLGFLYHIRDLFYNTSLQPCVEVCLTDFEIVLNFYLSNCVCKLDFIN